MVAVGPQGVETRGLPSQGVPTGCWLSYPVAVAIGEAALDGVEAALVPCRGSGRAAVTKATPRWEGKGSATLCSQPSPSLPAMLPEQA